MKTEDKVWGWCAFLVALACLILIAPAYASGDRITQSNDNNAQTTGDVTTNVSTTLAGGDNGDTNIGGDKAYAFGMGDVDINDCYRSYQVLIFQGSQLNYWCMADSLDAKGLHNAAAKTRCKLDGYRNLFGDEDACIAMNTMATLKLLPENLNQADDIKDDEDYHEKHEVEAKQITDAIVALRLEFDALQRQKANAMVRLKETEKTAQRAYTEAQTGITDQQRAELAEVFKK